MDGFIGLCMIPLLATEGALCGKLDNRLAVITTTCDVQEAPVSQHYVQSMFKGSFLRSLSTSSMLSSYSQLI